MAVFLGCLEYTLAEEPRWSWFRDVTISTSDWVAGLSGLLFIWRCLEITEPIVDLRALRDRNFALGCLFSFITGIGIFATIYLTPCSWAVYAVMAHWISAWRCSPASFRRRPLISHKQVPTRTAANNTLIAYRVIHGERFQTYPG